LKNGEAEGWREGEVSIARSEVSTMEVRGDGTPAPERECPASWIMDGEDDDRQ